MQLVHPHFQITSLIEQERDACQTREALPHPNALSPSAFVLCQPHPNASQFQLSSLTTLSVKLEQDIADAKKEQTMMLDLFQQLLKAQQGEKPGIKKAKRRTAEEVFQKFCCPRCPRFYTSDSSLKRHIRLKHDQFGDDPPEKYHTLHPEPELKRIQQSSEEESIFEEESSQKFEAKKTVKKRKMQERTI